MAGNLNVSKGRQGLFIHEGRGTKVSTIKGWTDKEAQVEIMGKQKRQLLEVKHRKHKRRLSK